MTSFDFLIFDFVALGTSQGGVRWAEEWGIVGEVGACPSSSVFPRRRLIAFQEPVHRHAVFTAPWSTPLLQLCHPALLDNSLPTRQRKPEPRASVS